MAPNAMNASESDGAEQAEADYGMLTEESALNQTRTGRGGCNTWALHPQSIVRFYWDSWIVLLMGYTCIVLPLSIAIFADSFI